MNNASINPASASNALHGDLGYLIAWLEDKKAAHAEQARGSVFDVSKSIQEQTSRLAQLRDANLVTRLTGLASIDGTPPSVKLGADLTSGDTLINDLEALGFSLASSERNEIYVSRSDKLGNVTTVAERHLATATEQATAEAATFQHSDRHNTWGTLEYRGTRDSAGNTTTYEIYRDQGARTAAVADVAALKDQILLETSALTAVVQAEVLRLKGYTAVVLAACEDGGKDTKDLRNRDVRSMDNKQAILRSTLNKEIEQVVEIRVKDQAQTIAQKQPE